MLLHQVVCLLDAAYIPLYILLILIGIASVFTPFLQDVSSHGKIRSRSSKSTEFKTVSLNIANHPALLLPKRFFRHFYITGLISMFVCIYLANTNGSTPSTFSLMLLFLHLSRRIFECFYVHQWKDSSRMHVLGYLLGVCHYLWLPLMFIPVPCRDLRCKLIDQYNNNDNTMTMLDHALAVLHHVPIWLFRIDPQCRVDTLPQRRTLLKWVGGGTQPFLQLAIAFTCLWAQYQQYRHHQLLASLRQQATRLYAIPTAGWFQWVSCPHYFAEILIYFCFAVNTELLQEEYCPRGNRHLLVLSFVVLNLGISAQRSHQWYLENSDSTTVKKRKALVPLVF